VETSDLSSGREGLTVLEVDHEEKFFVDHGTLRPDEVGGEDAEFLDVQAFEGLLNVFGVNVFSLFGDDHVFLAAEELQVPGGLEAAHVAGAHPAVHDGFGGESRFVEVAGHHRFAADGHFADAFGVRIADLHFHAGGAACQQCPRETVSDRSR